MVYRNNYKGYMNNKEKYKQEEGGERWAGGLGWG